MQLKPVGNSVAIGHGFNISQELVLCAVDHQHGGDM